MVANDELVYSIGWWMNYSSSAALAKIFDGFALPAINLLLTVIVSLLLSLWVVGIQCMVSQNQQ
jgi:hypothetical protein